MKKLLCLLLCLTLCLSLAPAALAAEGGGSDETPLAETPTNPTPTEPTPTTPTPTEPTPTTPAPTEPTPTDPTAAPTDPTHTHSWVTVTVPATCAEEGGVVELCSVCEEIKSVVVTEKLSHTYDNACDTDCNVCKATRTIEHSYSTGWNHNSRKHWHYCTICGAKQEELDHYPGPAATEDRDQLCLTCGRLMTAKLGHTHSYDTQWSSDGEGHWHACSGCEERKDAQAHTYDNSCDEDCSVCGYVTAVEHSYGIDFGRDAQTHWGTCELCGKAGAPEPHLMEGGDLCVICGYSLGDDPEHTHEFVPGWDTQTHWRECECGERTDSASHTWDAGTKEEGRVLYRCTACGATQTEAETKAAQTSPDSPMLLILGVALAAAAACIAALVFLLKPKKKGRFANKK